MIDLSFLEIFSIVFANGTTPDSDRTDYLCSRLDKYQAPHPSLRNHHGVWSDHVASLDQKSLQIIEEANASLMEEWDSANGSSQREIWELVLKAVPVLIIRMEFDQCIEMLQNYSEKYQHTLQIDSVFSQDFLEFNFYLLLTNVLQLVFQGIQIKQPQNITTLFDATTMRDPSPVQVLQLQLQQVQSAWQSLKAIEDCLKKAETYYTKNQAVLTASFNDELHYFYLTKWVTLLSYFKKFKVNSFVEQFEELYRQSSVIPQSNQQMVNTAESTTEYDEMYSPFALFSTRNEYTPIRELILTMYQVSLIMVRPFRELQFHEPEDSLLDLFEDSWLNSKVYYDLMLSLRNSDFKTFKNNLNDRGFENRMRNLFAYFLPELQHWDFFRYIWLLIDYKNFLAIMSVTRAIPKQRLIEKLGGYESDDESVVPFILQLMAVLKLGEVGISYNVSEGQFLNDTLQGQQITALATKERLDVLRSNLHRESIAVVVNGLMVSDFSSVRLVRPID